LRQASLPRQRPPLNTPQALSITLKCIFLSWPQYTFCCFAR
jgi:hypothetical protein